MHNPIPLVLPKSDWPDADRVAWQELFRPRDIFDNDTAATTWADGTRRKYSQSYSQWLSFLARSEIALLDIQASKRVTEVRIAAFIEDFEVRRTKPITVHGHLVSLYSVMKSLAPEQDWVWLSDVANRYRKANVQDQLGAPPPLSAHEVFSKALKFLAEAKAIEIDTPRPAISYRNALMMGLLVARPVRRRAFLALTVSDHLQPTHDGYNLKFSADDMKDKTPRSYKLPTQLIEPMQFYLTSVRPLLLQNQNNGALWLTVEGTALTAEGFADAIERFTLKQLGHRLNPHQFRHVAATSIATRDPENVNIIRDILGHATLDTAQRHYNRASANASCNALQSIVEDIRKNVPRMPRA